MLAESVVWSGPESRGRLATLGLNEIILLEAIRRGLAAWASCTSNHPVQLPGFLAWGETICALRELLGPSGWQAISESNMPLTVNRSGAVAITVATGDEDSGRPDGSPCTKSRKGARTVSAVAVNKYQLDMFPDSVEPPPNADRTTWLLLIHRDLSKREVRAELSQPINMDDDYRVDGWAERIVLGSIPFDDDFDLSRLPNGPQPPDVVVEVKKRA